MWILENCLPKDAMEGLSDEDAAKPSRLRVGSYCRGSTATGAWWPKDASEFISPRFFLSLINYNKPSSSSL